MLEFEAVNEKLRARKESGAPDEIVAEWKFDETGELIPVTGALEARQ